MAPEAKRGEERNPFLYSKVVDGLKKLYKKNLQPLEEQYLFHGFHSPLLSEADFESKPTVLLIGQYSTGKTSFIRYILGRDYPGIHVGPEPTTDRFLAVMHGSEDRVVPGSAATIQPDKPFRGLARYGASFLSRFQVSEANCPVLEDFTFIDTPGILSGEKQRIGRNYDFTGVIKWFAERSDLILLLFDAYKLDISDEFQRCIQQLRGHDDKVKVILNKADLVSSQQLMRVYGALMWSLGKVMPVPEVVRVYIGSFWENEYVNQDNAALFDQEREDLFTHLYGLPRDAAVRKINEFVKRARLAKVHACIIGHLKQQMPAMFGKEKAQAKLIEDLRTEFLKIQRQFHIPAGSMPDVEKYQEMLRDYDFRKFQKVNERMIANVDKMLSKNVAALMEELPSSSSLPSSVAQNPESIWMARDLAAWATLFNEMNPSNGKLAGHALKELMAASGLSSNELRQIWALADMDRDGKLDVDEFGIAMTLIHLCLGGQAVPAALPPEIIPESKLTGTNMAGNPFGESGVRRSSQPMGADEGPSTSAGRGSGLKAAMRTLASRSQTPTRRTNGHKRHPSADFAATMGTSNERVPRHNSNVTPNHRHSLSQGRARHSVAYGGQEIPGHSPGYHGTPPSAYSRSSVDGAMPIHYQSHPQQQGMYSPNGNAADSSGLYAAQGTSAKARSYTPDYALESYHAPPTANHRPLDNGGAVHPAGCRCDNCDALYNSPRTNSQPQIHLNSAGGGMPQSHSQPTTPLQQNAQHSGAGPPLPPRAMGAYMAPTGAPPRHPGQQPPQQDNPQRPPPPYGN
eukprot:Clim_evm15s128 gene=Clim_evmTU15s128